MTEQAPTFTRAEREAFTRYCGLLADFVELTHPKGYGGVVSRGGTCECRRPVPSGLPLELERGTYEICPACVLAKGSDKGMAQKLESITEAKGVEVLSELRAKAPAADLRNCSSSQVDSQLTFSRERLEFIAPEPPPAETVPSVTITPPTPPPTTTTTIARLERRMADAPPSEKPRIEKMIRAARAAGLA